MSRYQPSIEELSAIDLLTLGGYVVLRRRSHEALLERVRRAEAWAAWKGEDAASSDRWARRECDEQRRLSDRLTAVVGAAAAQGVSIQDINAALATTEATR